MATYRIVPYYSAIAEMMLYRLEKRRWYGWSSIDYAEDKRYLEKVMRHLEQPASTYCVGRLDHDGH